MRFNSKKRSDDITEFLDVSSYFISEKSCLTFSYKTKIGC